MLSHRPMLCLSVLILAGCNGTPDPVDPPVAKLHLLTPAEHPYVADLGEDEQRLDRTVHRVPDWGDGVHQRVIDGFVLSPQGASVNAADAINFAGQSLRLLGARPIVEAIEKLLADRRDMLRKGQTVSLSSRFVRLNSEVLPDLTAPGGRPGTRTLLWGVISKETSDSLGDGFRSSDVALGGHTAQVLQTYLQPEPEAGIEFGAFTGATILAGATLSRHKVAGHLVVQIPAGLSGPGWQTHLSEFTTPFALREHEELLVVWDFVPGRDVTAMVVSWQRTAS